MTNKRNIKFDFQNKENVSGILLLIYFFFLPLLPVVSIVSFILLTVYFFFTGSFKISLTRIKNDRGLKIFILYFLLHVFGMFYSSNIHYGFLDLQTKLTFLLFPLVLSGMLFNESLFKKIKNYFIIICSITFIILLITSLYQYIQSSDSGSFFYIKLSHGYHPTYLSIYFCLALLFVLEKIFKYPSEYPLLILIFLSLFLFTGILFLSARTSTIVTIFCIVFFPIFILGKKLFTNRNWFLHGLIVLISTSMFFGFLHLNNRFNQVEEAIVASESSIPADTITQEAPNSTNIRFHLWENAVQLIGRNPLFGVGTGDIKEELVSIYTENNYEYGIKERISPHNQFLHTGVILGITGMVLLAIYFFYPLYFSFKEKDWLYFFFLIIILLNAMTESILERQAGILFFTAFNTCFYLRLRFRNSIN